MKIKTNIKIGDTLYHVTGRIVTVLNILTGEKTEPEYPIKVGDIDNPDNVQFINGEPNIFGIYEWLVVKPKALFDTRVYYIKRPDIKIDTMIEIYDYSRKEWIYRYFAGWNVDDKVLVFKAGASSLTTNTDPYIAEKWRLVD